MSPGRSDDLLRAGAEALRSGDWERARASYAAAGADGASAEVLDGLSRAAHFAGEYDEAIALKERAFAEYRRRGDAPAAAEVARRLAFLHGMVRGNMAVAGGWMARAERLLEGEEESAAHGWVALDRAPFTRDPHERQAIADEALAIARRVGDTELEFSAIALHGHVRVVLGRVEEGMRLLDEAMAAIAGAEVVEPGSVGDIYCRLLGACEHACDVRRAEEWMAAADRLVAWTDFVGPICRCHYGGILIEVGRWEDAERELLGALAALEGGYRGGRASPLVRLADLRVRQGRLEEAERLLEGIEWDPAARASLAAIALARGEHALGEEMARACLEGRGVEPGCAPLLELLAQAQLARGDRAAAGRTAARLEEVAARSGDARARAGAERAAGLVAAAGAREEAEAPARPRGRAVRGPRPAARGRSHAPRPGATPSPRGMRRPPSRRPVSPSPPSRRSGPPATPTRRRRCCAGSAPRAGRERGDGAPSPGASRRCSPCSRTVCRTPRSRRAWSSAPARPSITWPASSRSSGSAAAHTRRPTRPPGPPAADEGPVGA